MPSSCWAGTDWGLGGLVPMAIPAADDLYDAYLQELRGEGHIE
jgi:hypothetical protein